MSLISILIILYSLLTTGFAHLSLLDLLPRYIKRNLQTMTFLMAKLSPLQIFIHVGSKYSLYYLVICCKSTNLIILHRKWRYILTCPYYGNISVQYFFYKVGSKLGPSLSSNICKYQLHWFCLYNWIFLSSFCSRQEIRECRPCPISLLRQLVFINYLDNVMGHLSVNCSQFLLYEYFNVLGYCIIVGFVGKNVIFNYIPHKENRF